MVGAGLVQRTAWANTARAIDSLRRAGLLAPPRMRAEPVESVAAHIHASGFFRTGRAVWHALCGYVAIHDDDVEFLRSIGPSRLRAGLLAVHGIGPEAADSIMLCAVDVPTFVVDAYAARIFARLGEPSATKGCRHFQAWLTEALRADTELLSRSRSGNDAVTLQDGDCHRAKTDRAVPVGRDHCVTSRGRRSSLCLART